MVLCQDTLCFLVSLAVEKRHPLCQGDCKNAIYQGILPVDEITIVHLLLAIQRLIHRNFGSNNALSMAFDTVLATGVTKLMQFSDPLNLLHLLKTLAFTWALFMIPLLQLVQNWPLLWHWACMWMALSISQRILQLNLSSAVYWPNIARWILWALLSGSLVFISPGVLHPLW